MEIHPFASEVLGVVEDENIPKEAATASEQMHWVYTMRAMLLSLTSVRDPRVQTRCTF